MILAVTSGSSQIVHSGRFLKLLGSQFLSWRLEFPLLSVHVD